VPRPKFNQTRTVNRDTKREWQNRIATLSEGKPYEMTLEPRANETRSNADNRHYWGYVVAPLAEFLREQEAGMSKERAKDVAHYHVIVPMVLGYDEVTNPVTGEVVLVPKPTHTLPPDEFADFVDRAIVLLNEQTTLRVMPREQEEPVMAGGRR
jgi:hypothetical protein